MRSEREVDVVIIGAGLTGLCAAWVLHRKGIEARVVDRVSEMAPCFRAEKIEPYQAAKLRQFGLLDARRPLGDPIGEIRHYREGLLTTRSVGEQYGIRYHDTVNEIRRRVEKQVPFEIARVDAIETRDGEQRVLLSTGDALRARLVVLATGGNSRLLKSLGFEQKPDPHAMRTLSFGFDLVRRDGLPFDFAGFNYVTDSDGIDYITLFRVGDVMRANLFTQWKVKDPRVRPMSEDILAGLERYFPQLEAQVGELQLASRVEVFPTYYYQLEPVARPGIVVLADEFQSVSPTTGTGLDKVVTDVHVLCERYLPEWLATPGMDVSKIEAFYHDAEKRWIDRSSRLDWKMFHDRAFRPRTAAPRRIFRRVTDRLLTLSSRSWNTS